MLLYQKRDTILDCSKCKTDTIIGFKCCIFTIHEAFETGSSYKLYLYTVFAIVLVSFKIQ